MNLFKQDEDVDDVLGVGFEVYYTAKENSGGGIFYIFPFI